MDADLVVAATPVDLARLLSLGKPVIRAGYEFAETGEPGLGGVVEECLVALPAPVDARLG